MRLPRRNHLTNIKNFKIDYKKKYIQKQTYKPEGFWFSCNNSWVEWFEENMNSRITKYIYEVKLFNNIKTDLANPDKNKLLVIKNMKELDDFHNKYFVKNKHELIDWKKVSRDYGGIEICPYMQKYRFKYNWYYTFDVASGCIWNLEPIIKKTRLIYHRKNNKYVAII